MSASYYYANQIRNLKADISKKEEEKEIYDRVLPIVENLADGLPEIRNNMSSAQSICENGGYVQDGKAYGQGRIEKCVTDLDTDIENLNSALTQIRTKKEELESDLRSLDSKLTIAQRNYDSARAQEAAAAAAANNGQ